MYDALSNTINIHEYVNKVLDDNNKKTKEMVNNKKSLSSSLSSSGDDSGDTLPREEFDNKISKCHSGSEAHTVCNEYIAHLEAELEPKRCFECKDKDDCHGYKAIPEEVRYFISCAHYTPKERG
jgi:hypothetical protein